MPFEPRGSVLVIGESAAARRACRRLEAAGYRVAESAWTRSVFEEIEKAPARTPSALAGTLVAFPASADDVEESRTGGFLDRVEAGGLVVLAGAVPPSIAVSLGEEATKRGLAFVDAPAAAEGGAIPVGGTPVDLERARPLLECLGTPVTMGEVGTGQQARLCTQIALVGVLIGGCEAFAYARAAGLDPRLLLQVLSGSGGASLAERFGRLSRGEAGDTESVAELLASVETVLADAESIDLDLPGVELGQLLYREVAEMGHAAQGAESLAALWQDDEEPPELVQILGR